MVQPKQKSDAGDDKPKPAPSGAPELSDEAKQKLEAQLNVDKKAEADEVAAEAEEAWARPDVVVGGAAGKRPSAAPAASAAAGSVAAAGGNPLKRFFAAYWRRKAWALPLTLVLLIGVLAAVPFTRYTLAAYVVSQPVTVTVTDQSNDKPVSSAEVVLAGQTVRTDSKGIAKFAKVKVGDHQLKVSKKYYKETSQDVFVDLNKAKNQRVAIAATGRLVPVSVVNKLTGKPLENVTLKASGTEVKTDKDGKAIIVLPADRPDLPIGLSNGGFNALEARVKVTDQTVKENAFALVPAGKLYFLSRASGKIDVVKTDLDGGNRQTAVAGSGKEEDRNTVLLASRDWKFLALYSKRDSTLPKLYLIDTSSDKLTVMDEGDASFALVGWSGHDFIYNVDRTKVKYYEPNRQALKSFNAEKKQLTTIDQTQAEKDQYSNYQYQQFSYFNLLRDKIVYSVGWYTYQSTYQTDFAEKSHNVRIASVGSVNGRKDLKAFSAKQYSSPNLRPYGTDELYVSVYANNNGQSKVEYYEYEDNQVKTADIDDSKYNEPYPTYLVSPDGNKTFWSEERDGKQNFYTGDNQGENGKQIATIEEGQVYGWYGNDYLLTSKKGSELYILPAAGGTPVKVADYHKPQVSYRGYGGGYGGL